MTLNDIANNFTNAAHLGFLTVSIISFIAAIIYAFKKNGKNLIIALIVAFIAYGVSQKISPTTQVEFQEQLYHKIQ